MDDTPTNYKSSSFQILVYKLHSLFVPKGTRNYSYVPKLFGETRKLSNVENFEINIFFLDSKLVFQVFICLVQKNIVQICLDQEENIFNVLTYIVVVNQQGF